MAESENGFRTERHGSVTIGHGCLDASAANGLLEFYAEMLPSERLGGVGASFREIPVFDATDVTLKGTVAIAVLSVLVDRGLRICGLSAENERLIRGASVAAATGAARGDEKTRGFFGWVDRLAEAVLLEGRATLGFIGRICVLSASGFRGKHCPSGFCRVFVQTGADAVPVTLLVGFLLGLILAFEAAIPLRMFGAEVYVANLMGISILRELAVLVAAVVMAGRTASAFAAELGTMVVNEEVDALRAMGMDPVERLAFPRVWASALSLPLLSVFAAASGMAGGYIVLFLHGYSPAVYWEHAIAFCGVKDIVSSLVKASIFGLLIGGIGCYQGLRTGGGSDAVGRATTAAVVQAIVWYAISDGLFAVLYSVLGI